MTIQGKIEDVLSKMANENIEIIGSGRTDMGVHAYGQVANFKTTSNLSVFFIFTVIEVPTPFLLLSIILPPWSFTISLLIASQI